MVVEPGPDQGHPDRRHQPHSSRLFAAIMPIGDGARLTRLRGLVGARAGQRHFEAQPHRDLMRWSAGAARGHEKGLPRAFRDLRRGDRSQAARA